MAKKTKKSTTNTGNYGVIKVTAFWGIIISGISGFTTFIIQSLIKLNIINGAGSALNSAIGIMNLIANISLFVSVFLAAYAHANTKTKTWKILFWVFSVLAFLAILGFNVLNMF